MRNTTLPIHTPACLLLQVEGDDRQAASQEEVLPRFVFVFLHLLHSVYDPVA